MGFGIRGWDLGVVRGPIVITGELKIFETISVSACTKLPSGGPCIVIMYTITTTTI